MRIAQCKGRLEVHSVLGVERASQNKARKKQFQIVSYVFCSALFAQPHIMAHIYATHNHRWEQFHSSYWIADNAEQKYLFRLMGISDMSSYFSAEHSEFCSIRHRFQFSVLYYDCFDGARQNCRCTFAIMFWWHISATVTCLFPISSGRVVFSSSRALLFIKVQYALCCVDDDYYPSSHRRITRIAAKRNEN